MHCFAYATTTSTAARGSPRLVVSTAIHSHDDLRSPVRSRRCPSGRIDSYGYRRTAVGPWGRERGWRSRDYVSVQEVECVGAVVHEVDAGPAGHDRQAEQGAVSVRAARCWAGVQHLDGDLLAGWCCLDHAAVAAAAVWLSPFNGGRP